MITLNQPDTSSATALLHAIERELAGTVTTEGSGDWFVFYDPDGFCIGPLRMAISG